MRSIIWDTCSWMHGDVRALVHGADGLQLGLRYLPDRAVDRHRRRAPQRVAVEDGAADTPGQGHDIPEDEDDAMMCRFLVVALKYLHNDHPLHGTWPQGLCL